MNGSRNVKYAALLAAAAACFAFVLENVQATRLGYRIEDLRREITELENGNKYLEKEIRLSMSPEHLQAEAARLGLMYPEPGSIIHLDEKAKEKPAGGWLARLF